MLPARQIAPAFHAPGRHPAVIAAAVTAVSALALHLVLFLLSHALFFNPHWIVYRPHNAILVAALVMVPRRFWPWILLGAAFNQVQAGLHAESAVELAADVLANLIAALLPAIVLPPFHSLSAWIRAPRIFYRLVGVTFLLAPLLSSIPQALACRFLHGFNFWRHGAEWFLANSLGMALCLPLILALRSREMYELFQGRALPRTLSLLALTSAVSWFVFHQALYPVAFLIVPFVVMIGFQLSIAGSALLVNLLTAIAAEATLHGRGPFQLIPAAHAQYRLIILQAFLVQSMLLSFRIGVLLLRGKTLETELKDAYRRMEIAASEDGLTGIPNRRRFDLALQSEWTRAQRGGGPLGLLMIDVDYFKLFNDTHGHVAGDECLRQIAQGLASLPHRPSDLLARYGGEEFAFLLPGANETGLHRVAGRLRAEIESLHIPHPRAQAGVVTISIGGATLRPEPHSTPETLIHLADQALYSAKLQGRNRTHLHSETESLVHS